MGNRYIRIGATFNGNGESPELATVDGGIGAWNHGSATTSGGGNWSAISYLEGVAPPAGSTLPNNSTVFIRSKDAAGLDIIVAKSVGIVFGAQASIATEIAPITWVVDDGTIWPGVTGSIIYNITGTNAVSFRIYNNFIYPVGKFTIKIIDANFGPPIYLDVGYTKNLKIDFTSIIYGQNGVKPLGGVHENLVIKNGTSSLVIGNLADAAVVNNVTFINPQIELTKPCTGPVFKQTAYYKGQEIDVYGGRVYGTYATDNIPICSLDGWGGKINLIGFQYPREMKLALTNTTRLMDTFYSVGADGKDSSEYVSAFYTYTSRFNNFYPTLNAITDENVPWVYSVYPYNVSIAHPAIIFMSKKYNAVDAIKAVTVNFLWPQSVTMGAAIPTTDRVYIIVQYITTGGVLCSESTRVYSPVAIAESSAGWSSLTYGATLFKKYSLSLTTASPIAENSTVLVHFHCTTRSGALADILIVDPDAVIS